MNLELSDFGGMKSMDIIGLLYGYKKIISTGLEPARMPTLKEAFEKYGLCYKVLDPSHDYKHQNLTYLISKSPVHIKAAAAAYRANRYDLIGELLGYPECCVREYYKRIRVNREDNDDFVRRCAANSRELFWPINNVLDFDGRLCGKKAAGVNLAGTAHPSLISHNPCSYDCKPSLELAKLNYTNLKSNIRRPGEEIDYSRLAKPVLYVDDFNLALLDGTAGPAGVKYRGVTCALGFGAILDKLNAGDQVSVAGNALTILRGGKKILSKTFPVEPLLLPFDNRAIPGILKPRL